PQGDFGNINADLVKQVNRDRNQYLTEDVRRRDDGRDDQNHHNGVPSVTNQERRGNNLRARKEINDHGQLEKKSAAQHHHRHGRDIGSDVELVVNLWREREIGQEVDRNRNHHKIAKRYAGEKQNGNKKN